MKRLHILSRLLFSATVCVFPLAGCIGYSEIKAKKPVYRPSAGVIGPLAEMQRGIMSSMKVGTTRPLTALGGYLEAAEFSYRQLASNPKDEQARLDYNFATARIISIIQSAKLDPWNKLLQVPSANGGFTLTNRPNPNPRHNPALFDFTPADEFDIGGS